MGGKVVTPVAVHDGLGEIHPVRMYRKQSLGIVPVDQEGRTNDLVVAIRKMGEDLFVDSAMSGDKLIQYFFHYLIFVVIMGVR